jgi:hypothetical protein
MRSPKVRRALQQLGAQETAITHATLDGLGDGMHVQHLRAILVEGSLLPYRDEYLARFEHWLSLKLEPLPPDIRQPVERFATWHHLRQLRRDSDVRVDSHPPVHNAKQEVWAAIQFLTWLKSDRHRILAQCRQADLDLWLSNGTSTRYTVRNFLRVTGREKLAPALNVPYRTTGPSRQLTHAERIEWIRRCLVDDAATRRAYTAALLLLLYAQPVARICELQLDAISEADGDLFVTFSETRVWIPEPFAQMVRDHVENRSLYRTRSADENPFLFPGGRSGGHITRNYLFAKIRELGINVLAAKNGSLNDLVLEMPAPIVAEALGYSQQATAKHAALAGDTFARYVTDSPATLSD